MRSEPRRLAALLLALGALPVAGCATREIETTPFRLRITMPDGTPLPPVQTGDFIVTLQGVATLDPTDPSKTTLVIQSAQGPFRLAFSNAAAPDVQFPDFGGQNVVAHVLDAAGFGLVAPGGEAIDYPGLRIATAADGYQFLLGESPVASPGGLPLVPRPLDLEPVDLNGNPIYPPIENYPIPEAFADYARFVPSSCGLLYYDLVRVGALDGSDVRVLERGQRIQMAASSGAPWTVLHVLSWHRNTTCRGRPQAWTQIAFWR
jgi:hypothetical protein